VKLLNSTETIAACKLVINDSTMANDLSKYQSSECHYTIRKLASNSARAHDCVEIMANNPDKYSYRLWY